MKRRVQLAIVFVLSLSSGVAANQPRLSVGAVESLLDSYQKSFGHSATGLVYHNRLDGPRGVDELSSTEEVARSEVRGESMPWGYGSGIQDVALENGQLLFALCEAYDATGNEHFAKKSRSLFAAIQAVARISPEAGFVPRGPHPDGKSYYRDSSRDQHAAYIEALWRYGRTSLATEADKEFIADTLGKIAARMERNDWRIMNEDNSAQAHVGWTWKQFTSIGAITLLSALAQVADATGDRHWQELYDRFSAERDGERWTKWLHPDAVDGGQPLHLYANQFSQSLTALRRIEKNPRRRQQLADFQRRWAERALDSNVFAPDQWRRLDWAGARDEAAAQALITPLGFDLKKPRNVLELYNTCDRQWWSKPASPEFNVMQKLAYGLCTVAVHGALLADDPQLRERVRPTVARMVQEFSENQRSYRVGENYNRVVILGLLSLQGDGAGGNSAATPAVTELPILGELGCGPCMDAAVAGDRMFIIGRGRLHVADISDPKHPRLLGVLPGLGNTRQIVVDDDVAYVSSREDGVFLVDVSDPAKPSLLSHYNSVELATGLALAGDVLFVAQRHYGVEQVDVSDPRNPRHLSTVRTGEAQSIAYHAGHLYVGVWATSEVVVVDMRNARAPRVVSRTPLDGYGDGVDVRDGVLYAATGHHSRARHARETDPGFGHGHGLEIFDLSEPAVPVFISRVKFPRLYEIGHDMWSVTVANGHAFVADTHNGVFVVDVRDSRRPSIVGRRRFPQPVGRDRAAFIGGLALGTGVIYAAGGWTDLYVLDAADLAVPATANTGAPPQIGQARKVHNERVVAYHPDGQVYGVALAGEDGLAVAACGAAGLHVVRVRGESFETLSVTSTEDFATDVYIAGRTVYAAEGRGGLSIWEISDEGRLARLGTYGGRGQNVRYVVVPPPGKFALVEVGGGQLHIVDVAVPAHPRLMLKDSQLGLFYGHQLLDHLVESRHAAAFWHVSGLHWYDLVADPPRYAGSHPAGRFGMTEGLALFRGQILATRNRGYVLFDHEETRPFAELPVHRLAGVVLRGKPTIAGDFLYAADRVFGKVTIANLTNPDRPTLVDSFDTPGNPGRIVVTEHGYLVPNGYDGLLLCKSPPNSSNVHGSR